MSTITSYFERALINGMSAEDEMRGLVELLVKEDRMYHLDDKPSDICTFDTTTQEALECIFTPSECYDLEHNLDRLFKELGVDRFWDIIAEVTEQ